MGNHCSEKFRLVSSDVTQYINRRIKYMKKMPEVDIQLNSRYQNRLIEESNRHSVSIEILQSKNPGMKERKRVKQEKKESEADVACAYEWADSNYFGTLDANYIAEVGKRIDPGENMWGFRRVPVRLLNSYTSPPSPQKVDREMNIFLWENESLGNPLEKAVHAHFNIARVHPFTDGNGRTSRLIQNVILKQANLPIPTITLNDRGEYLDLIENAVRGYTDRRASMYDFEDIQKGLNELATKRSLTEAELENAKKMARHVFVHSITSEQSEFYNYLGLKVLEGFNKEFEKAKEKRRCKFRK